MTAFMKHCSLLTAAALLLSLQACGGGKKDDDNDVVTPADPAPVTAAIAGPTAVTFMAEVTLDASGSTGPDGEQLRFLWSDDAENPPNNFFNAVDLSEPVITFTADEEGTFTFYVTVSDAQNRQDMASITFNVERSAEDPVNFPPDVTGAIVTVLDTTRFLTLEEGKRFVMYTTGDKPVEIELLGDDPEGDPFDTYGPGRTYARSSEDVGRDTDGFHDAEGVVWLDDGMGGIPKEHTVDVRVVPKLFGGVPFAYYVDCAVDPGTEFMDGSAAYPFHTIQAAYDEALNDTRHPDGVRPDVYVATGTCEESVEIGLDGVSLYGMFIREENWRRRTNPQDREADALAEITERFVEATILRHPTARHLMYTPVEAPSGSFYLDGFSFELGGENVTALNMVVHSDYSITITNNTFSGAVTDVMIDRLVLDALGDPVANDVPWQVGGGVSILTRGAESSRIVISRNLFEVDAQVEGASRFQANVFPSAYAYGVQYPRVFFYGNVFHGGIGSGTDYRCRFSSTAEPFAFCFYRETDSGHHSTASQIRRNDFYVTEVPASPATPVLMDFSSGKVQASANIVQVLDPGAEPLRLFRVGGISLFTLNRFPVDEFAATPHPIVFDGTAWRCIRYSTPRLGTGDPDPVDGTCSGIDSRSTTHSVSDSRFFYADDYDGSDLTRPWRIFEGAFTQGPATFGTALPILPHWDFDGAYGKPDGATNYSIGAFEPDAPMY